jgi:crossover junction endodeoxyribonuclease RusA
MSGGITIELPFPAKILWPNGRGHWAAKNREFQKHKAWAFAALLVDGGRFGTAPAEGERVQWSVTFYPKTRHAIDEDNAAASLKAYQDGLAEAMRINDSRFARPTIHFAEPVKNGRVVITVMAG